MSRIVVVSYWFYPENSARSFHTQGLVTGLINEGFSVDLVVPGVERQQEFNISNSEYRFKVHSVRPGYFLHKKKYRRDINQSLLKTNKGKLNIFKSIYNRIIWPDRTIEFTIRAINYIKKLRLVDDCTKIITIGLPISTHIVGHYFKKRNKKVTWIADYGDPYTFNKAKLENTKRNYFYEKRLVKIMDRIVIPTEKAINAYEKLGVKRYKINIIHQLFMNNSVDSSYEKINKSKFNILYAGAFYKNIRSPKEFLLGYKEAFLKNNNLSLHFFGNQNAINEYLQDLSIDKKEYSINTNNYVDRSKLLSVMKKMDLLVNINNSSAEQVPSKIIDYLYAKVKILNIGNRLNDDFINCNNNCSEISKSIIEAVNIESIFDYSILESEYSYSTNLKRYLTVIKEECMHD